MKLGLAGDCILQHPCTTRGDAGLGAVVDLLRTTDAAICNFEGVIPAPDDWPAFVAGQGGFGSPYLAAPRDAVAEVRALGFSAVSLANNHASDFGERGVLSTCAAFDQGGVAHAGTGRNLTEATAAAYVPVTGGRIALLAASDNGARSRGEIPFPTPRGCLAADQGPWFADRPGVNMVRYEPLFDVPADTVDTLRRVSDGLGWEFEKQLRRLGGGTLNPSVGTALGDLRADTDDVFHFHGSKFRAADGFGVTTLLSDTDAQRNYRWIDDARRNADLVVMSFHQQGVAPTEDQPPAHTVEFAHGAIDAGADIFVAHGSSRFGGIEIYRGKPIFYGLPGFISQLMQRTRVPAEQVARLGLGSDATPSDVLDVTLAAFRAGLMPAEYGSGNPSGGLPLYVLDIDPRSKAWSVRMYPMKSAKPARLGGFPRLLPADDPTFRRVVDLLVERSAWYGTAVEIADDHAVVRHDP